MDHVIDDFDDLVHKHEFADCGEEREPWRWLYYDDLDGAFEAVVAADVLGMSWKLRPAWSDEDGPDEHWVIELSLEVTLPLAARGEITRDVD